MLVPGMSMSIGDFQTEGLVAAVEQRGWPVSLVTVDPGVDAYLDGSVDVRLSDAVAAARRSTDVSRVWLAGISLGCQGILRCVRAQPGLAEGVILLTPYLASTGLMAEVAAAGGLRAWAAKNPAQPEPDREFLRWLATTPRSSLPRMLVGRALGDRFASTATALADLIAADSVVSVPGDHDWSSWRSLWQLMLDRDPFIQCSRAMS